MLLAKQLLRNKKAILIVTYMHQVKDCFIESRNQHDFSIQVIPKIIYYVAIINQEMHF